MLHRLLAGLRARLLVLVLLAIIPALGLIVYTAAEQRRYATANIQEDALQIARLVSAQQKRLIDETRQFLETISLESAAVGDDPKQCQEFYNTLLAKNPQYTDLGKAQPDGQITCSAAGAHDQTRIDNLLFYQNLLQQHDFSIGSFQLEPVSGKAVIGFGYPTYTPAGQLVSIAFAELDITWFNRDMDQLSLPANSTVTLFDNDGTVLVRYPEPMGWVGETLSDSTLVRTILKSHEGTVQAPDLDGVTRLFAFTPVDPTSKNIIYVSVGMSDTAAFAAADQVLRRDLLGLGLVMVLALTAAWLGGDFFLLRHVRALLRATTELMAGNLKARTGLPDTDGELSQLARVFDNMAAVLEQRDKERKQAEQESFDRNRDLETLNQMMSAAVSSSLKLPAILDNLKEQITERWGIPGGAIYLYDEASGSLSLEGQWGLPDELIAEISAFASSDPFFCSVVQEKQVVSLPDFRVQTAYAGTRLGLLRPDWKGYLSVPLLAKGSIQGIIDLFYSLENSISTNQEALLTTFGQQVGVIVQNALLFEQIRTGRERLEMLSQQILDVQEAQSRHLARELHDEIGQALTAIKVNLQSVLRSPNGPGRDVVLDESIAIIDRTVRQIRSLSADLRPSVLDDLGVVAAIRSYLDRQARRADFEARFTADPPEMRLRPELETICFRIVQEAITNVIRHAHAKHVRVELRQQEDELELWVQDDGVGFDVRAAHASGASDASLGLMGMEERVRLVGGQIEIQSEAGQGQGARIRVRLPLQPDPAHVERRAGERGLR